MPDNTALTPTEKAVEGVLKEMIPEAAKSIQQFLPVSYEGMSTAPFAPEVAAILMAPIEPHTVEIKPDGIVYFPEMEYRRRLHKAFGPGGWALRPVGPRTVKDNVMFQEWAFFALGRFVAQTVGQNEYRETNAQMTWGDVAEGVKSNALSRCCKDLGIASELWDKSYVEKWIAEYAVQVWRDRSKYTKPQWRRKDRQPFYDETGFVGNATPNPSPGRQPAKQSGTPAVVATPTASAAQPPAVVTPPSGAGALARSQTQLVDEMKAHVAQPVKANTPESGFFEVKAWVRGIWPGEGKAPAKILYVLDPKAGKEGGAYSKLWIGGKNPEGSARLNVLMNAKADKSPVILSLTKVVGEYQGKPKVDFFIEGVSLSEVVETAPEPQPVDEPTYTEEGEGPDF